ncbi:MAG: T9SS type A sorting domain-containing protein [Bacteroidales bacterium]|nr:T9SS type A sorting domain-containing protein [Bacteroidales bacterium]
MKMILHLRNLALMAIMMIAVSFNAIGVNVVLTSPNGGEIWAAGSTNSVTWTDGTGTVTIDLYDASGTNIYGNIASGVTSPYSWIISGAIPLGIDYRIKITDDGDASTDFSDADFRITDPVIVTDPDGGEIWATGSTKPITWTDGTGTATIDLYDISGTNFYGNIATGVTSPYSWIISGTIPTGLDYRIKITDDGDLSEDFSNADFQITDPVILTDPNGGEIWAAGSTKPITWTDGTGTATIELYSASGVTLYGTIASGVTSPYNWTISGAIPLGIDYRIKITDDGDASTDFSDADFRITDPVILTDPNGGEIWAAGSTKAITWTDGTGTATIDLYDISGTNFYGNIASGVTSPYSWIISGAIPLGIDYRIKITDDGDASTDFSDADFRITDPVIVTDPDGGEIWVTGSTKPITWTDGTGTATIDLYDASGTNLYGNIASGVTSPYSWIISGAIPTGLNYRIKITDDGDLSEDFSNADFRITHPVVVTSPNGGESWATASSHNITWTDGTGTATIELYSASGVTLYGTIASGVTSPYNWTISGAIPIGTQYRIKIIDDNDASVDMSNSDFAITQFTHVSIPNTPGISWNLGTSHNITWTDNVPGPVKIDLYYAGVFHSELSASVPDGTNSFLWAIPTNHLMGNHFSVRVSSVLDYTTVLDYSDFQFRIDAATNTYDIELIQPNVSGIIWTSGQDYLISWTDNINSPVKIDLINYTLNDSTPIAASVVGSTYSWHIPDGTPNGTQYKILITSTTANGVQGLSTEYFQISDVPAPGVIVIEQPTVSGLTWLRGSSYLISWTDNVQNNVVNIVLCDAGGSELATLATGVSGSTWVWTIPALTYPVGNYKIKVVYNSASGISVSTFAIADSPAGAYIDILQPDVSGITWLRNQSYLISWEDNIPGPVDIFYERTADPTEVPIASNVVGSTYVWTIPLAIGEFNDYFITIRSDADATKVGISANPFAILDYIPGSFIEVVQPNGGETWTKGNSYYVSWDNDFDENVKIELVNDATATTTTIDASVPGSTTVWTIPNTGVYPAGILYRMKISSTENPGLFDLSDAYFTIVDPAAAAPVVYPNPADLSVTVSLADFSEDNYNITLTDRLNMQFVGRTINSAGMKEFNISTAFLPNGVYFLTIASDKSIVTKKVIIQH